MSEKFPFSNENTPKDEPAVKAQENQEETPGDFRAFAGKILGDLEKKEDGEGVSAYPQSVETTSNGARILIDSLIWDQPGKFRSVHGGMAKLLSEMALIATDESTGKIVGLRSAKLGEMEEAYIKKLILEGEINVRERNKGIATTLALASLKNIQQLANERNAQVTWLSVNANLSSLKYLERKREMTTDEQAQKDLDEKIAKRKIEQERWQNLYGEKGKVSFQSLDKNGILLRKPVRPDNEPQEIKQPIDKEHYKKLIEALKECTH